MFCIEERDDIYIYFSRIFVSNVSHNLVFNLKGKEPDTVSICNRFFSLFLG
jgi:hypothetical protein